MILFTIGSMQIFRSRKLQTAIMIALMSMSMLFIINLSQAATSDTSDGSFTLNSIPEITVDPDFVDAGQSPTATLDPDDSTVFGVKFRATHSAGMSDILNVTIYIYDDSVHGADADDGFIDASPDGLQLTRIVWTESDDSYAINQGSLTQWTSQASVDPGTANASTTGDWTVFFDISNVARADTDWNVTVTIYDDDGVAEYDSASEVALVTMNNFFSASLNTATFSWGNDIQPLSVNNTHGALILTIIANAQWELVISGIDFTPGPIDIEANNILTWDQDGAAGDQNSQYVRNTPAVAEGTSAGTSTWDDQTAHSVEAGDTRNVYIFLTDPGALFSVGQLYTFTLTILIQANT